ncbi:type II and III secretion system protein family protein [Salinisphaera aquimarina]|uniref:Type II and III secretion system protein family protein n=1 Tax=Salinisphaera aquimarina TaxID=2094031 RepID=A0ABV7EVU9_9GAMM
MRHRIFAGVWLSLLCVTCVSAQMATGTMRESESVRVGEGQQKLVRSPGRIERVAIGDPGKANVNVIDTRDVMLTGIKRGDTSLIIWTRGADKPVHIPIVVGAEDLPDLVRGDKRAQLKTQVQTDIRIAEVSRSALRQIGFNFVSNAAGKSAVGISPPGASAGIGGLGDSLNLLSSTGFQPIGDAFNLVFTDSNKDTAGLLSILERRGLMRTLAEPSLVAMSGQTASFLAGGEFPIPVTQGGGSGVGNNAVTIEFKEFGIRLSLTPTVLSQDRIVLKVAPEVSELDFDAGVTLQGITVPGVRVRRTDTTVELGDGESFILSGLVDQNLAANVDKVPWLGDLPFIGAFFRNTRYNRQNRELIMVVTPHLVSPLARGTKVPLPGDEYDDYNPSNSELFFRETGDFDPRPGHTGFSR